MSPARILPNIGGEERPPSKPPAIVARVRDLFGWLFPAETRCVDGTPLAPWPEALPAHPQAAAFAWLEDDAMHAWWNDDAAAAYATPASPLAGAPPEIARRVHDKAFAQRFAEREGYTPRALRGLVHCYEPEALRNSGATAEIRTRIATWPAWTGGAFTLKPRFGSSGRGRVGGTLDSEPPGFEASLRTLADRGGAILEPWCERVEDVSAQFHIAQDGALTLLGTLGLELSTSGVYRGHRGHLDHRHRIGSNSPYDTELLAAAAALARAASSEGYHGPCGVDAFAFRGPDGVCFRPVCELNARFTLGTLVIGLLRQLRPAIAQTLGPATGSRLRFSFDLAPSDAVSPERSHSFRFGSAPDAASLTLVAEPVERNK